MTTATRDRCAAAAPRCRRLAPGFTLIESTISIVLVSLVLVSSLNVVGASATRQHRTVELCRGHLLAQGLMSEILALPYAEPIDVAVFGLEAGELTKPRTAWDDIDDYVGWSASPPVNRDGSSIPNVAGWTRNTSIEWVHPNAPHMVSAGQASAKRITVTVKFDERVIATLVALRTEVN